MMKKSYQRKHLRAPFKESVLYADGPYVLKARCLNISEGGLLVSELPSFPEQDELPVMLSLPRLPVLKNLSLLKLQTFSQEIFPHQIIRIQTKMVRRAELSLKVENIFNSFVGLQFEKISPHDQKLIEEYVITFASNLVYLQTLIDSFNVDNEIKNKTRLLASILGYNDAVKISQLRAAAGHDYKSLQWL